MQATRTLPTIVLLLSVALSGPAIAEYPFDSMHDSAGAARAPLPSRPLRGGARNAGRPSRRAVPGVTQASHQVTQAGHESPPVHAPLVDGAMPEHAMIGSQMVEGPMMPAGGYDTVPFGGGGYDTLPYEGGGYDTVPFGGGGYDTVPYEGGPYGGRPYAEGPYDTVPYDGFDADGGPMFDEPHPQESLFGFDSAIWPGFVSGNLTPGTDRFLFGGELFLPLYQDGRTLWYFNFRGQGDDNSASEFNTGTGVRTLSDPGWIFGAYTYWDHLRSRHGNTFNQGMIGVEAMSVLWDARMNVYFPESSGKAAGPAVAAISGGNLVVRTGIERAYWGMDFELGHLLWAYGPNAQHELRGFAAIYHFDHSAAGYDSITGPRVRGEYRWHDLPYFGPGSRFTCGLTLQADGERDAQLFAFARLRIPLDPWAHSRRPLSPLHRRMLDNVVRDVDVVTNSARRMERAINPVTGREIRGYARIDANTSNVDDLLDGLDTDSVIVLDGSQGVLHASTGYQLKSGQTVIGADTPFNVVGASSRRRATFDPKGERPTLDFKNMYGDGGPELGGTWTSLQYNVYSPVTGLAMNTNTQLIGVDIQNVGVGVGVRGAENVLVQDVEISDFSVAGIEVSHSSNVKLADVTVRDAWLNEGFYPAIPEYYPPGAGIRIGSSNDVEVVDSLVDDTQREGILIGTSQDITIRNTTIRDTKLFGIRAVKTKNLLIENVELKNTGKFNPSPHVSVVYGFGGISLHQTENTRITDSIIHGSDGDGIVGNEAISTEVDNLHIDGVNNGILFYDSQDLSVTDTTIVLDTLPDITDLGLGFQDQAGPALSGISLFDPAGGVLLKGNEIRGGYGAIFVQGAEVSTNLRIEENTIEKLSSAGHGIQIDSRKEHDLQATISGNTVNPSGSAFWMSVANGTADDPNTRRLTLSDNEWNGTFYTGIYTKADVEMVINGDHLGGNPMGEIRTESGSHLNLEYTGNTSNAGAGMLQIINDGGNLSATIEDNDHTPTVTAP